MGERKAAAEGARADDAEGGRVAQHWTEVGEDSPRVQGRAALSVFVGIKQMLK